MSKLTNTLHKLYGTNPSDPASLQPKEALAYGVAGFGQNFICTIIGSYLTIFLTDALLFGADGVTVGGVAGSMAVAWLMLGTRIFDAFNDPIMGSVVDKTRTKWGKCRPYLKWMAIPIAIMTIACFLPFFQEKATSTFIIVGIIYVIWSVAYTIADVPYWGLSTCMTNDTVVRGNLLTVTRLLCTLGAGIVTVFVPIITGNLTAKFKYTDADIYNSYGPTEVTVASHAKLMKDNTVSEGKPIHNTIDSIVDIDNNPLPNNIVGNIALGGVGVSAGYWNKPELTLEVFYTKNNIPYYNTGDLGYKRDDGELVVVGRADSQIKLRGLRIETGEIENSILKNINL